MKDNNKQTSSRQLISSAIILVMVAILAITAVSFAWFTISDNTRINSLNLDVTTGKSIRIDITAHDEYADYKPSLTFDEIKQYVLDNTGRDYSEIKLDPVTTTDGQDFTYEKGEVVTVDNFVYMEYTLHFIADCDAYLNLSGKSDGKQQGTIITSNSGNSVVKSLRMSFTAPDGKTLIYDPDGTVDYTKYGKDTYICTLPMNQDVPIVVRIWVEGTDPECTNAIKTLDYAIHMRFEATDFDFNSLT